MIRKNNERKSSNFEIFPSENRKCFFVIENEFQRFEKKFIQHQLRKRSDFVVASTESLDMFGIEFLIWFTKNIQGDLTPIGESVAHLLHAKLKMLHGLQSDFTMQQRNEIMYDLAKYLK